MDQRPIGVFDSGLGGLTAVHSLWRILPEEDLIYFGDTARVPYGSRSREAILKYARQDVRFLRSFDLKGILIACGTVTTTSLAAEGKRPAHGGRGRAPCRRAALAVPKQGLPAVRAPGGERAHPAGRRGDRDRGPGYLTPLKNAGVDTLILGCTHYPLLTDVIGDVMGPGVELVSAGAASAFELKRMLKARELRADGPAAADRQ